MLNRAEIGAGFQHVGRAGVPKQMGMNALLETGALPCVSAEISNRPLVPPTFAQTETAITEAYNDDNRCEVAPVESETIRCRGECDLSLGVCESPSACYRYR